MSLLVKLVLDHPATALMVAGWIGTALTSTIPAKAPRTVDEWWNWGREFVHQVSNAKRPTPPNP